MAVLTGCDVSLTVGHCTCVLHMSETPEPWSASLSPEHAEGAADVSAPQARNSHQHGTFEGAALGQRRSAAAHNPCYSAPCSVPSNRCHYTPHCNSDPPVQMCGQQGPRGSAHSDHRGSETGQLRPPHPSWISPPRETLKGLTADEPMGCETYRCCSVDIKNQGLSKHHISGSGQLNRCAHGLKAL